MNKLGAEITSTESVLFELLEKSGTPEFKAISARADEGVRAHGRDYSGMLDYYGDDCRQVADAAKVS